MCQYIDRDNTIVAIENNIDRLIAKMQTLEAKVAALENKRPPKAKERQSIDAFSPELVHVVRYLRSIWPTHREDNSSVKNDPVDACVNLQHILNHYDVTLDELKDCANEWISSKPAYPNAIQFFFGRGKGDTPPRWLSELTALRTRREALKSQR